MSSSSMAIESVLFPELVTHSRSLLVDGLETGGGGDNHMTRVSNPRGRDSERVGQNGTRRKNGTRRGRTIVDSEMALSF